MKRALSAVIAIALVATLSIDVGGLAVASAPSDTVEEGSVDSDPTVPDSSHLETVDTDPAVPLSGPPDADPTDPSEPDSPVADTDDSSDSEAAGPGSSTPGSSTSEPVVREEPLETATFESSVGQLVESRTAAVACSLSASVRPSSVGSAPLCVESRLVEMGYPVSGAPDRYLDTVSLNSLKTLAASSGLPWRGVATAVILNAMGIWSGPSLTTRCAVSSSVWPGTSNNRTACLESRLMQLGYDISGPDQRFDPTSVASLKLYQQSQGLTVNGIAGKTVLRRLGIWTNPPVTRRPSNVTPTGSSIRSLGAGLVALTFDDGPSAYTGRVLDVLARYGVPATFFVVGGAVGSRPSLLRRAVREGHSVQNHTWNHPALSSLSDGSVYSQLDRTSDAIQSATGRRPTCYRPPYGSTSSRVRTVARAAGLSREILWNVDPSDYRRPSASTLIARSLAPADGRGLIILLHDGGGSRSNTVAALPGIVSGLRARGYTFVSLCD